MLNIQIKNGPTLDLNQDDVISLNYNFNEVDLALRKSNFSKSLYLPSTKNNDRFFKHYFRIDLSNESTYNTNLNVDCQLLDDNNILIDGVMQLKGVRMVNAEIVYVVTVFDKIKKLYTDIGDRLLSDIDFSEYDHERTGEAIYNSYLNIANFGDVNNPITYNAGVGYRYPHVFNQEYSDSSKVIVQSQFPSLFLKEYIDRIFKDNGYTYKSDFFNSPTFKKILLPFDKDSIELEEEEVIDLSVALETPLEEREGNGAYRLILYGNGSKAGYFPMNQFVEGVDNGQYETTYGTYTIEKTGSYNLTSTLVYEYEYYNDQKYDVKCNNLNGRIRMDIIRIKAGETSGEVIATQTQYPSGSPDADLYIYGNDWEGLPSVLSLQHTTVLDEGDRIFVLLVNERANEYWFKPNSVFNSEAGTDPNTRILMRNYNTSGTYSKFLVQISPEDSSAIKDIEFNRVIPSIKQKDLISEVIKFFNLRVIEDKSNKFDFIIEPYVDLYGDGSVRNIKDWTTNVDTNLLTEIIPNPLPWSQYQMVYTKGKNQWALDYFNNYNSSYGDLSIDIDNDFSDDVEEYKSKFTSVIPVEGEISDRIMPYNISIDDEGQFDTESPGLHMIFWGRLTPSNEYTFYQSQSEAIADDNEEGTFEQYRMVTHLSSYADTDWDLNIYNPQEYFVYVDSVKNDNVFNTFHKGYLDQLTMNESRILRVNMNLTSLELSDLNPIDLIFINGDYFNILNIKDWDNNKSTCLVELYRQLDVGKFIPSDFKYLGGEVCPMDISSKWTWRGVYLSSASEGQLSKFCCESLGGSINSVGACVRPYRYVTRWPSRDYGTVTTGSWLPSGGMRPYRDPYSLPLRSDSNNNVRTTTDYGFNTTWGRFNRVSNPYSMVLGNYNIVTDTAYNSFVIGDYVMATKPNSFYFGDFRLDFESGNIVGNENSTILLWQGGKDSSYDVTKINDEDILQGGNNAVFNQSNVSRNRPTRYNGDAPFV